MDVRGVTSHQLPFFTFQVCCPLLCESCLCLVSLVGSFRTSAPRTGPRPDLARQGPRTEESRHKRRFGRLCATRRTEETRRRTRGPSSPSSPHVTNQCHPRSASLTARASNPCWPRDAPPPINSRAACPHITRRLCPFHALLRRPWAACRSHHRHPARACGASRYMCALARTLAGGAMPPSGAQPAAGASRQALTFSCRR